MDLNGALTGVESKGEFSWTAQMHSADTRVLFAERCILVTSS